MSKVRSIRGEIVDFSLLKMKEQMQESEKPDDVQMREEYVNIKRRRNPRRSVSDLVSEQQKNKSDVKSRLDQQKRSAEQKVEEENSTTLDESFFTEEESEDTSQESEVKAEEEKPQAKSRKRTRGRIAKKTKKSTNQEDK